MAPLEYDPIWIVRDFHNINRRDVYPASYTSMISPQVDKYEIDLR